MKIRWLVRDKHWGLVLLALMLSGCGGGMARDGFTEINGTVTLDGSPLPNAQIIFETPKGMSYGRTDEKGWYQAEYSRSLTGGGTGTARVTISTKVVFRDEKPSDLKINPRTGEAQKEEKVPPQYNTRSKLSVEIKEGGAPYNFDLTSKSMSSS